MKSRWLWFFHALVFLLAIPPFPATAGEQVAAEVIEWSARVLTNSNHRLITAERNVKIALTVPETTRQRTWRAADFSVFVYPKEMPLADGAQAAWRVEHVLFWNVGNYIFFDIRALPKLEKFGDYAVAIGISDSDKSATILADGVITHRSENIDVVLLIDSSFSMHKTDPDKKRLRAARAFLQMVERDDKIKRVGVVSFNENTRVLAGLTPLTMTAALTAVISQISAYGQTNIGKALLKAADLLDNSERSAVILLTDGKNESVPYADEHRVLAAKNIPVYTIGLSSLADQKMLQMIADTTGGRSFWTAEGDELTSIYLDIAAELGSHSTILGVPVRGAQTIEIPVDPTVKELCLLLDDPRAEFTLQPPVGAGKIEVVDYLHNDFIERRITAPPAGIWRAQIKGADTVKFLATAQTTFYLDAFPPVATTHGWVVGATLADNGLVVDNSKVLLQMNGEKYELADDGEHLDGEMNDGIYAMFLPQATASVAKLSAENSTRYRREALITDWQRDYVLPEQLNGEVVFGEQLAGTEVSVEAKIFYAGAEWQTGIRFLEMVLKPEAGGEEFHALSHLRLPKHFRLRGGENILPLKLNIPPELAFGKYSGELLVKVNGLQVALPVSLDVRSALLQISPREFDLGYLNTGEPYDLKLTAEYDGIFPAPMQLTVDDKLLPVAMLIGEISGTAASDLTLTIASAAQMAAGDYEIPLTIAVGAATATAQVKFSIALRGDAHNSRLVCHELILPSIGEPAMVSLPTHEMYPRYPTREMVVRIYAHELHLASLPPEPMSLEPANVFSFWSRDWLWRLFIGVGAAVILWCIRRVVENRFARFALLSAIIHLPLLALLAAYLFPEKSGKKIPQSTMLVNLVSHTADSDYLAATTENPDHDDSAAAKGERAAAEKLLNSVAENLWQAEMSGEKTRGEKKLNPDLTVEELVIATPRSVIAETPRWASAEKLSLTRDAVNAKIAAQLEFKNPEKPAVAAQAKTTHALATTTARALMKNEEHWQIEEKITPTAHKKEMAINSGKSDLNLAALPIPEQIPDTNFARAESFVKSAENIPLAPVLTIAATRGNSPVVNNSHTDTAWKNASVAPEITVPALPPVTAASEKITLPVNDRVELAITTNTSTAITADAAPAAMGEVFEKFPDTRITRQENAERNLAFVALAAATIFPERAISVAPSASQLPPTGIIRAEPLEIKIKENLPADVPVRMVSKTVVQDKNFADEFANFSTPFAATEIVQASLAAEHLTQTVVARSELLTAALPAVAPETPLWVSDAVLMNYAMPTMREAPTAQTNSALSKNSEAKITVSATDYQKSSAHNSRPAVTTATIENLSLVENTPAKMANAPIAIVTKVNLSRAEKLIIEDSRNNLSALPETLSVIPATMTTAITQTSPTSGRVDQRQIDGQMAKLLPPAKSTLTKRLSTAPAEKFERDFDDEFVGSSIENSLRTAGVISGAAKNKITADMTTIVAATENQPERKIETISAPVAAAIPVSQVKTDGHNHHSDRSLLNVLTEGRISAPALAAVKNDDARAGLSTERQYTLTASVNNKIALARPQVINAEENNGAHSSNVAAIGFSLGMAGTSSEQNAIRQFLQSHQIEPVKIAISERELRGCEVVLIAEKARENFSARETVQLKNYLNEGGKLWLHNCGGLPNELYAGREIIPLTLTQRQEIFGRATANNFRASAIFIDGVLSALATDGDEQLPYLASVLNYLAATDLFAVTEKMEKRTVSAAPVWQNFSGLDPHHLHWAIEKWSNPATVGLSPDGQGGEALHIKVLGGTTTRTAVSYTAPDNVGRRIDLSGKTANYADIYNAGAMVAASLSLTNQTPNGWDEFETAPVQLQPGWNRGVKFSFTNMKSRRGAAQMSGLENCAKISYHLHTATGDFLLDNLRWE